MKKLLILLATMPLSLAACNGSSNTIEDFVANTEMANVAVQDAFKSLLMKANEGSKLTVDGAVIKANWYGKDDSVFQDEDIKALTLGQAYRASLYFSLNTLDILSDVFDDKGTLASSILANDVAYSQNFMAPGFFKEESKTVTNAVIEQTKLKGFKLAIYQNVGAREDVAEMAQSDWNNIDTTTQLETTDLPTYLQKTFAGEHSAYVGKWTTITGHAGYGLWGSWHSSAAGEGGNRQFVAVDAIDEALEVAQFASEEEAEKQYKEAQLEIAKLFPAIPLSSGVSEILLQNIKNIDEITVTTPGKGLGVINKTLHHDWRKFEMNSVNKKVTIGLMDKFNSLHPIGTNDTASSSIHHMVYETLWRSSADALTGDETYDSNFVDYWSNETEIEIELGKSIKNNQDGSISFNVKTGVKWNDWQTKTVSNDLVSPEQISDSINRAVGEKNVEGVTAGIAGAHVGPLDSVPEAKENTITIFFGSADDFDPKNPSAKEGITTPLNAWKQVLSHPALSINKIELDDHANEVDKIFGTGNYVATNIDQLNGDVTLEKVTDHRTQSTVLNEIVVFDVFDSLDDITAAFKNGEIDIYDSVVSDTIAKGEYENTRFIYSTYSSEWIGFNVRQTGNI